MTTTPNDPTTALPGRPPVVDLLLAAFFVAMTLAEQVTSADPRTPWQLLLALVAMTALAVRRQLPIAVAVLVVLSNLLTNPQGDFAILLSVVLVSFSVGFETDPPRSGWGLALVLVPFFWAKSTVEERWLATRYPGYDDYRRRTRRFIAGFG